MFELIVTQLRRVWWYVRERKQHCTFSFSTFSYVTCLSLSFNIFLFTRNLHFLFLKKTNCPWHHLPLDRVCGLETV